VPALLITMLVTWVLVRGVRESAGTNTVMVAIKIAAILIFCIGAAGAINPGNWHPVRAARLFGHSDRRLDRLLHLHRFRFGLDGGGGVQATRSAICRSASSPR
jgi:amino acid transporter